MRRRLAALSAVALLLTTTAACGSDDKSSDSAGGDLSGLTVTGDFGKEPTIKVDGLDVKDTTTKTLIEGDGEELTDDDAVLARAIVANGKTGDTVVSNYANNDPQKIVIAQQPSQVKDAISGEKVGSRVAIVTPVEDLYGSSGAPQVGLNPGEDVVLVFDLIKATEAPLTEPKGKQIEPPSDAPKVIEQGGAITGLDFSDAPKADPSKFQVIPLVEGEGPKTKTGDTITVNYIGTKWGVKEGFNNSYTQGQPAQFTLNKGGLIDGFLKGLTGIPVGSRVMLIIPPDLGYGAKGNPQIDVTGKDTLVFVVDVLGIG